MRILKRMVKYLHGREWGSHHVVIVVVHRGTAHRGHRRLHAVAEMVVDLEKFSQPIMKC
jgi:hypothetical protein